MTETGTYAADDSCASGWAHTDGSCVMVIATPHSTCDIECLAHQNCEVCIGGGGGGAFGGAVGWGIDPNMPNCITDQDTGNTICDILKCADITVDNNGGLSDSGGTCIATQPGQPSGHCSVGPSQWAVHDTISPNNGPDTTVTNINWLSNGGYMTGMMYKGADGHIYVQPFYNNPGGISLGVGWRLITLTIDPPTGWGAVTRWDGQLPPGTGVHQCWDGGGQIPGTDVG